MSCVYCLVDIWQPKAIRESAGVFWIKRYNQTNLGTKSVEKNPINLMIKITQEISTQLNLFDRFLDHSVP